MSAALLLKEQRAASYFLLWELAPLYPPTLLDLPTNQADEIWHYFLAAKARGDRLV